MTRVLVTSVGSSPGLDVCRCLRRDPALTLIGGDAGDWGRRSGAALCDAIIPLPRADRGALDFLAAVNRAIDEHRIDFLFIGLDVEVEALVEAGRYPNCAHALPSLECASIFLDKAKTADIGPDENFPATAEVEADDQAQFATAFAAFQPPIWLRPAMGTSGQGSLKAESVEEAWTWVSFWRRRGVLGRWMLQEYLPGRNVNWSGIYTDGACVAYASMERQEYYLSNVAVSGITGQVRRCVSIDEPGIKEVSQRVIASMTARPHGVFSVDLRFDRHGVPKVNEINPRLAGRPSLFAQAQSNLPLAALRALTGQPVGDAVTVEGGLPGVRMYRQLDQEAIFLQPESG